MSYQLELFTKNHYICTTLDEYLAKTNFKHIIPSPKKIRYRNKINFSFSYFKNKIECGPLQKDGSVFPAMTNKNCSNISVSICQFMKNWIKDYSKMDIFDKKTLSGVWRHITIFNNRENKVMIVLHINNLSKYKKLWELEYPIVFKE